MSNRARPCLRLRTDESVLQLKIGWSTLAGADLKYSTILGTIIFVEEVVEVCRVAIILELCPCLITLLLHIRIPWSGQPVDNIMVKVDVFPISPMSAPDSSQHHTYPLSAA